MTANPNELGDATTTFQSQTDRPASTIQGPTDSPALTTTPVTAPIPSPTNQYAPDQVASPASGGGGGSGATLTQTVQTHSINRTSFVVGNTVRSAVDGRIGTIVTPDNLVAKQIGLNLVLVPSSFPILPSSTPAPPLTDRVKVNWADGTSSIVPLSTLRRA